MKAFSTAAALLVVLLAIYVGAYYGLVERRGQPLPGGFGRRSSVAAVAAYRFGGDVAERFFWPAHWCDRTIRSYYWSPEGYWADFEETFWRGK